MAHHLIAEENCLLGMVGFHILFKNSFQRLRSEADVYRAVKYRALTQHALVYVASTFTDSALVLNYIKLSSKTKVIIFFEHSTTLEDIRKFKEDLGSHIKNVSGMFFLKPKLRNKVKFIIDAPTFLVKTPIDLDSLNRFKTEKTNDALILKSNEHPTCSIGPIEPFTVRRDLETQEIEKVIRKLSETKFVLILEHDIDGAWIQIAAALGCIVLGPNTYDEIFYFFPYTVLEPATKDEILDKYNLISNNQELTDFLSEFCRCKVQHTNRFNSQARIRAMTNAHLGIDLHFKKPKRLTQSMVLSREIWSDQPVHEFIIPREDFIVCCLVKDGMRFAKPWLHHYRCLGARHFLVVDNGSSDGTAEFFSAQQDVTLFRTELAFKYFESDIRQYMAEIFCQNIWCLTVDIDEFFDYPRSLKLTFKDFLRYLNSRNYTAVTATMMDMFNPEKTGSDQQDLIKSYCFYDLSNIRNNRYETLRNRSYKYNVCRTDLLFFYGGVRAHNFDNPSNIRPVLLLKHPLTFQDGYLTPQIDPHFCDHANIADVSCVLWHFKLADFNKELTLARANEGVFNYYANQEYQNYLENEAHHGDIYYSIDQRKLQSIEDLAEPGITYLSAEYISYSHRLR